jgi:CheY-like chemotaxis protein
MWEKIVLNLLSNAFKFTLDGASACAARGDGAGRADGEDTGVGIPGAELPRVFERFHRIEGTRARTHEGPASASRWCRISSAARRRDRGREPAGAAPRSPSRCRSARAPRPPTRIGRAAEPSATPAPGVRREAERWLDEPKDGVVHAAAVSAEPPSSAERARIVLADDNADMRDYVRRLLGNRWEWKPCATACRRWRRSAAAAPISSSPDVMMPELDGFGLLRALRGDEATQQIPVLMLSARAGEEMRLEGLQAGADDYLVKPFSARELLARVEMLLLRASMRAVENLQRRQLADIFMQVPTAILDHARAVAHLRAGQPGVRGPGRPSRSGREAVREALPELDGQGIYELLDDVYETGQPYVAKALRVMLVREAGQPPTEHFFDVVYQPLRDATGEIDGIAVVAFEVSELARAAARPKRRAAPRTSSWRCSGTSCATRWRPS